MLCKETESQQFQWVGGGNVRIHRRAVFGCGRAAGGYVWQLCKGRGASLAAGVQQARAGASDAGSAVRAWAMCARRVSGGLGRHRGTAV